MNKIYEQPEITVIEFSTEAIMAASGIEQGGMTWPSNSDYQE